MFHLYGMPVVVDENAMSSVWVFPKDRFIEYGPEDEKTCRYFGIGHEEWRPACYQVGGKWLIHPTIWDKLIFELGAEAEPSMDDIIHVRCPGLEERITKDVQRRMEKELFSTPFDHSFQYVKEPAEQFDLAKLMNIMKDFPVSEMTVQEDFPMYEVSCFDKPTPEMKREFKYYSPRYDFKLDPHLLLKSFGFVGAAV